MRLAFSLLWAAKRSRFLLFFCAAACSCHLSLCASLGRRLTTPLFSLGPCPEQQGQHDQQEQQEQPASAKPTLQLLCHSSATPLPFPFKAFKHPTPPYPSLPLSSLPLSKQFAATTTTQATYVLLLLSIQLRQFFTASSASRFYGASCYSHFSWGYSSRLTRCQPASNGATTGVDVCSTPAFAYPRGSGTEILDCLLPKSQLTHLHTSFTTLLA
jgi:hypothetical protein